MSGAYSIPVSGLKEGHHTFNFRIDKAFFDLFEDSEIKEGELEATADIDRRATLIDIRIRISGKVSINCDRCLEMFDFPMECENSLVIKFGPARDESDPEIITLPRDEYELELKQYLYEYIHLALPIQRIHPDDRNGVSTCNQVMLKKLQEHLVEDDGKSDPRWDELKKLINDN